MKNTTAYTWENITEEKRAWAISMLEEASGTDYENIIRTLEPIYNRIYGFENDCIDDTEAEEEEFSMEVDADTYSLMQEEGAQLTQDEMNQLYHYTRTQNSAADAERLSKLTREQCTAIAMILQTELSDDIQLRRTAMLVTLTSLRKWMVQLSGRYLLTTPQERQDFYQELFSLIERKMQAYDSSENTTIHTYLCNTAKRDILQIVCDIKGWKSSRYDREHGCKIEKARRTLQNEGILSPDEKQIASRLSEMGENISLAQVHNIIDRNRNSITLSSTTEDFDWTDHSVSIEDSFINREFSAKMNDFIYSRLDSLQKILVQFYRCVSEGTIKLTNDAKYNYVTSSMPERHITRSAIEMADDELKTKLKSFVRNYGRPSEPMPKSAPLQELTFD